MSKWYGPRATKVIALRYLATESTGIPLSGTEIQGGDRLVEALNTESSPPRVLPNHGIWLTHERRPGPGVGDGGGAWPPGNALQGAKALPPVKALTPPWVRGASHEILREHPPARGRPETTGELRDQTF
jgi:hypothetical protein